MAETGGVNHQQETKPNPDPTVATNDAVARAVRAERDYVDGQLEVLRERLNGIDTATSLRLRQFENTPEQVDEKVGHLGTLMVERFDSVQTQFRERDTRSERESRDNKVAVDAAFAAQKEAAAKQDEANQKAIDKSEKATNETINKNNDAAAAANKALSDKIEDQKDRTTRLEDRVSRMESAGAGRSEQRTEGRAATGAVYAFIGAALGVIGLAMAIIVAVSK